MVMVLGEAALASRKEDARTPCLYVEALAVDTESVFRQTYDLQKGLWDLPDAPDRKLLLAGQYYLAEQLMQLVYVRHVVSAALERGVPDRVQLTPPWISIKAAQPDFSYKDLQAVVRMLCAEKKVSCRSAWGQRLFDASSWASLRLSKGGFTLYLAIYDSIRIIQWTLHLLAAPTSKPGSILIANFGHDLTRQFDVERLDIELSRRCLVWKQATGELVTLTHAQANERFHGAPEADREGLLGRMARHLPRLPTAARSVFPTLASVLVARNSGSWIFRLRSAVSPESGLLQRLLGDRSLAEGRMMTWRRLAYTARVFAETSDILRGLKPAALVTGDSFIIHRAMTLAARDVGVPCLATSHGLNLLEESFFDQLPISSVHALFGQNSLLVARGEPAGLAARMIVCHDSLALSGEGRTSASGRRVMIVTSRFLSASWVNNLFIWDTEYERDLRSLVAAFASLEAGIKVVFKPHPTEVPLDLYEKIRDEFPDTVGALLKKPLGPREALPADVVIFYNCVSTLFFTAVAQGLPVISHTGALTPLARRMFATSDLSGSPDSRALARMAAGILSDPEGTAACEARSKTQTLNHRFLEPSIGGLSEALNLVLCEPATRA